MPATVIRIVTRRRPRRASCRRPAAFRRTVIDCRAPAAIETGATRPTLRRPAVSAVPTRHVPVAQPTVNVIALPRVRGARMIRARAGDAGTVTAGAGLAAGGAAGRAAGGGEVLAGPGVAVGVGVAVAVGVGAGV